MSSLPYESEHFDAVTCNNVLQHGMISDITKTISEIHRILKTRGIIFLEVASTQSSKFLNGREIEQNTRIDVGGYDGNVPHHFFTESEIKKIFKKFRIIKLEHFTHPSELNPKIMSATWVMLAEKN